MSNPRFVITIGRQFGSGGRELGKKLAEMFGIAYYDKELIAEVARESGLTEEYIENADEQMPRPLMHAIAPNLTMSGGVFGMERMPSENIFKFQSDVIREVASRHSCVIVGRCADYILRDHPLRVSTFIAAPDSDRIARLLRDGAAKSPKEAEEMMRKIDKRRAAYYDFYTSNTWGSALSYDLCIDSSILGIDDSARLIGEYVLLRTENHHPNP